VKVIRIGSRKSDLARIQAYTVAQRIRAFDSRVRIEFFFSESLGDKNLTDPLWKMPEKGVFTQDFVGDLLSHKIDLVVHSWKDLPTENRPGLEIAGTLTREDPRDVLLTKKQVPQKPILLSSSPRRQKNLSEYLSRYFQCVDYTFENVRGNISTRIRKLLENEKAWGLVVAKAALDRLTEGLEWKDFNSNIPNDSLVETSVLLKDQISDLHLHICPLTENPTAPAQGALALEIRSDDHVLKAIIEKINCAKTFRDVLEERKVFKSFGGGCHQKIGITFVSIDMGTENPVQLQFIKGESQDQSPLPQGCHRSSGADEFERLRKEIPSNLFWSSRELMSPKKSENPILIGLLRETEALRREKIELEEKNPKGILWCVAKDRAWPLFFSQEIRNQDRIWCAGLKTQQKLQKQGLWVAGNSESMGLENSNFFPNIKYCGFEELTPILLSFEGATPSQSLQTLATYKLEWNPISESLRARMLNTQVFYWSSFFIAQKFLNEIPEIFTHRDKFHFCGLGRTYESLKSKAHIANLKTLPTAPDLG
jgi:hydroxymethylbilane synthase